MLLLPLKVAFIYVFLCNKDNKTAHHQSYFTNSETVFLICYAIIMLNTDLHRVNTGGSVFRQMTCVQFLANLQHIEEADEIYLSNLYSSVLNNPIQMPVEDDTSEVPGSTNNSWKGNLPNLSRDLSKVSNQVY